jgi:hypothetical protein
MNTIVEFAALAAVLSPVAALAGLNFWLWLTGEEGTLLVPWHRPYPSMPVAIVEAKPVRPMTPANDAEIRRAA